MSSLNDEMLKAVDKINRDPGIRVIGYAYTAPIVLFYYREKTLTLMEEEYIRRTYLPSGEEYDFTNIHISSIVKRSLAEDKKEDRALNIIDRMLKILEREEGIS